MQTRPASKDEKYSCQYRTTAAAHWIPGWTAIHHNHQPISRSPVTHIPPLKSCIYHPPTIFHTNSRTIISIAPELTNMTRPTETRKPICYTIPSFIGKILQLPSKLFLKKSSTHCYCNHNLELSLSIQFKITGYLFIYSMCSFIGNSWFCMDRLGTVTPSGSPYPQIMARIRTHVLENPSAPKHKTSNKRHNTFSQIKHKISHFLGTRTNKTTAKDNTPQDN